ncbi:MAG: type II secretion system protein N [Burkholderiaceae bacterium]
MLTLSAPARSKVLLNTATLVIWLVAAVSAAYWALRLTSATGVPPAAPVVLPAPVVADTNAVARLLGWVPSAAPAAAAAPPPPVLATRLILVGVVADRNTRSGAALIAIDGKPPRPYRVGARLEEGVFLQSVAGRSATVGATVDGPMLVKLEMPAVAGATAAAGLPAATNVLAPPFPPPPGEPRRP